MSQLRRRIAERGWALLPLRLIIGFGFAAHGYAKLSRGPGKFASVLAAIGIWYPLLTAWATSLIEFIGGICLMAGVFVMAVSVPLAAVMLTAIFTVHFQYGFLSVRLLSVTPSGAVFGPIGYEMNLLYLAGLFILAIDGGGQLSIESLVKLGSGHSGTVRQPGGSSQPRSPECQLQPGTAQSCRGVRGRRRTEKS